METQSSLSISLQQCSKTFADGTRALEPINLDIHAGETLVLLGPSGCGKTTTLRMIAGQEQPDHGGKVMFDGVDVTALPIEKRNVGMVFQSYALFPNMTVAENIGYGLKIRKMPSAESKARVAEMLAMMQIERLADRRITQLSGGQCQRVALARAIAVRPRALLLDEPLTALDAKLRDSLRLEINGLLRQLKITSVYVTHDQTEAMALGDRIVVMEHGRIAQIGTPREIYQQPANTFVADFIGIMNRLNGKIRGGIFSCKAGQLAWQQPDTAAHSILFRPEDIKIAEAHENTSLRGTVNTAVFMGDRTRILVDVGERQPLVIDSHSRYDFKAGDKVGLHIDTRGIIAL
ncbi:ABC transporter ATP-binding protein [Undibacterium sp. SXout11W]|uniref:ABC transporter ATP-binding protein n=1 Tax=Undibacterium sp. SXout11W TaxID=3413050 RepID=UPI003BF13934